MVAVAGFAAAASALAQGSEYTPPGTLGRQPVDRREQLAEAIESARWRFGPVRVEPWLALREVAWVEQQRDDGESERDFTASGGVGAHFYLPIGSRTTLAAQALPHYVWWEKAEERRDWAGRYGAGVFLHGNRLLVELIGRTDEGERQISPEIERRISSDDRRLEANVEVPLGGSLSLFGRGSATSLRFAEASEPQLDLLERDDREWLAGVRWRRGDFAVALGAGGVRADFERAPRDARGESLYGELSWSRSKLSASAALWAAEMEATDGSQFEGFDGTLGRARIGWQPRDRFLLALYGQESFVWSVEPGRSWFVDRRVGSEIGLTLRERGRLRAFVESGEHRYSAGSAGKRTDDTRSVGAGATFPLGRHLSLGPEWRRTEVTNRSLGVDRSFDELRVGLVLGFEADGVF